MDTTLDASRTLTDTDRPSQARRRLLIALLLLGLISYLFVGKPVALKAAAACSNAIACENALPGTPASTWDIDGVGDESIQGFATAISTNAGGTVSFKIDTNARAYSIQIYRLGYYQGNGARLITTISPSATLPQTQPACATDVKTEIYDCGTWKVSASWNIPATAVSGVYIARLIRTDTGGDSHIPFIVRKDGNTSDVLFQTSDTTWQAYNTYGGSNFYTGHDNGRAYKLSYNRPFATRGLVSGRDFLFSNEYPMIRFLEQNGYDVSYVSGLDTSLDASLLGRHKAFVSTGHDEYWSKQQRANVTAARDAGVNMAYFSGNEVYWKTRWEPSQDGTNTANRTLVCYKDTWANERIDPVDPTPTWRDPRFGDLGFGTENSLTGTAYMSNSDDLPITVNASEGKLRLWRSNPTLNNLAAGTSVKLADHTIGYESDEDLDNGLRPAGLIDLSTTVGSTPEYLRDFGNTVTPGTTTHHLTQYRAASGALVFSAGSIQWAWGLDATHDGVTAAADPRIRQATVNILADMGALATTIVAPLVATTKSTDTTPPTSVVTSPTAGSSIARGSLVTVKGTASDTGGGVVGGVEVSVDGGASFHPATGRESWTYSGILNGTGAAAIQVRATDDSSNLQSQTTKVAVDSPCPCSIFGAMTPLTPDGADTDAVTLGTQFKTSASGFVTGVRFYKATTNTGTHTGTLYSSTGSMLATGTFTNETASGWQTLNFSEAVPVTAGSTYVAAYRAPKGHYSADQNFFASRSYTADTLTALGGPSNLNGVYSSSDAFPSSSYQQTNYYVDAVFSQSDSTPLNVIAVSPVTGSSSILTTSVVTARFNKDVTSSTISMKVLDPASNPLPGAVTYSSATKTATFTPSQPMAVSTKYTATVSASADGSGMAAPYQWSFTTVAAASPPGTCPCTLFDETDQPTGAPDNETTSVQLGVAFSSNTAGVISGVRFFKPVTNTGTHVVKLSKSDGTVLATATVVNESTAGWQQANFSSAIAVTAGTTYVASYTATVGRYAFQANGLSAGLTRTPLSTSTNAGRYTYGTGALTNTSSANYFVDPVFNSPPGQAPTVASISPGDKATSVNVSAPIRVTFDGQIQPGSASISVAAAGSTPVAGTATSESQGSSVTFTPSSPLTAATKYTVTVTNAKSPSGTAMAAPFTSTFTTSGASACPCSLLETTSQPAQSDSADPTPTTLGLRFTASVDGFIKGLRYYRDAANTGTHTGKLYTSTGTELASLTFTDAGTGWQTANFSTAVAVTAGTTYVASYYAPVGHYSATTNYYTNQVVNAPLSSINSGGVYSDGNNFPSSNYLNTNYFVDVIFTTNDSDPPSVTDVSPTAGATAAVDTAVTATFARAIDSSTLIFTLTGPSGPVSGQLSYDASSQKATFQPAAALAVSTSYTASVKASSLSGVPMTAPKTWAFTTSGPPPVGQPVSLFAATATPDTPAWNDPGPVTVGVRFSSTQAGQITAIKFYAGPGNTGGQTATLWSNTGASLATGTATGSGTGWRTVTFATPVAMTAGTTYVASYYAPAGHYSVTSGTFNAAYTAGPLTVPAGGATYRYPSGYPTASSGANYWVDVIAVV